METEKEETKCVLLHNKTTRVIMSKTAECVTTMQVHEETRNAVRNFSQLQAVSLPQDIDPLGIDILDNLSCIPKDDAILYVMCHISRFHELVNQKLIQEIQLSALIQVVGNLSSRESYFELQKHIIRIATNQRFLNNILRFMTDSLSPRIDLTDEVSVYRVLYRGKTVFTVGSGLKHLLAYFTFVQEYMKEFASVEFTECSKVLWQLMDGSKEHSKTESQQSSKANFGGDFELNSVNSTLTETKSQLRTPFFSIIFLSNCSEVIKMVYNRRNELCMLANSNFNFFLHIIGSKMCGSCLPNVRELLTELLVLISTSNFCKQLSNYTSSLNERLRMDIALKLPADGYSESAYIQSTLYVFGDVLSYCNFLVTDEIREFIPADVYTELNKCVSGAKDFLSMCPKGEVFEFLSKHHKNLHLLKNLYDQTARNLKSYLWHIKATNKSPKAYIPSSSRAYSQAQKAQESLHEELQNRLKNITLSSKISIPITITSSMLVQPTADVISFDNLTQICQMPVDEVFDILCAERRNLVDFIIHREISDKQLNLIAVIWSTLCSIPEFVHFQKYVFSVLLNDTFLSRLFTYTRQRLHHFGEQKTQLYSSTTEFFGSLFTIYNLLWIHSESEPEENLTLLKRNIRSVYDQLARLTVTYPQNKKIKIDGSTLAALGRFNERFKNMAEATKERTERKKGLITKGASTKSRMALVPFCQ